MSASASCGIGSMLSKRIIACLDVRDGKVVKGVNFEGLRDAGDPGRAGARYNVEGIDEIVILDVTATIEARRARAAHDQRGRAGDFSAALRRRRHPRRRRCGGCHRSRRRQGRASTPPRSKQPALISTLARRYGSQAVIVAIDAKTDGDRYRVYARSGQARNGARRRRMGARGDRPWRRRDPAHVDRSGWDQIRVRLRAHRGRVGGRAHSSDSLRGRWHFEHFAEVFTTGCADAALAASIFHFNERMCQRA